METYEFEQYAPSSCTVHAALLRSSGNTAQLLQDLKTKGAEAFPTQLALIDAAYIISRNHILVAVHQALLSNSRSVAVEREGGESETVGPARGLKTRSIHSEVLWNLSISSNIMDSFRTFGVSEKTKDVLVVHIADMQSPEPRQILDQIMQIVKGTLEPNGLDALDSWRASGGGADSLDRSTADWEQVKKVYKLQGQTDRKRIENLVTSMVAMKNVAA